MEYLADDRECDPTIAFELEQAGIEIVHLAKPLGEVRSRVRGKLGPITFSRDWVYWVAKGPVPLAVAQELYNHPIGRREVRVQGHGMRPPPQAPWVSWYTREGIRVYPPDQEAEYRRGCERWPEIFATAAPVVFHRDPKSLKATGYVDLYHLDSADGLRIFAATLRKHGIDRLSRPPWWEQHHQPTMEGELDSLEIARAADGPALRDDIR